MDRDQFHAAFDLTDRVAVVTGGSRGIGRAIAGTFAAVLNVVTAGMTTH